MHRVPTAAAAALLCAMPAAQPQGLFPDGPHPQGVVLDERGEPIAGAAVLVLCTSDAFGYRGSLDAWLRRDPLPTTRTSRDGTFVLQLLDVHRLPLPSTFVLRVEKDGFDPWVEPLTQGTTGWLGSRVVLRRTRPSEWLRVRAPGAPDTLALLLWREATRPELGTVRLVGLAAGEATVALPELPCPLSAGERIESLSWHGQLVAPGWTSAPRTLAPSSEPLLWPTRASGTSHTVRRSDGTAVTGLEGLYRYPDGQRRWIPLDGDTAILDPELPLLALVADGCRVAEAKPPFELAPLPLGDGDLLLAVVDAQGAPVPTARALLLPLEAWRPAGAQPHVAQPPLGIPALDELLADAAGRLRLRRHTLAEPCVLRVQARGFEPHEVLDPRGLEPLARIELAPLAGSAVTLELTALDGEPVAGASLWLSDSCRSAMMALGEVPHTDGDGKASLGRVPPGPHNLLVLHPELPPLSRPFAVEAGKPLTLRLRAPRAAERRVLVRDGRGQPVPFARLQCDLELLDERWLDLQLWPLHQQPRADSLGRLVLRLPVGADVRWRSEHGGPLSTTYHPAWDELQLERDSCFRVGLPARSAVGQVLVVLPGPIAPVVNSGGLTVRDGEALLLRCPSGCPLAFATLGQGPPVCFGAKDLAAAKSGNDGLARLAVPEVRRRIPLDLRGVESLAGLRIVGEPDLRAAGLSAAAGPPMPWVELSGAGSMVEVRDGRAWWVARDAGPWSCRLLHPDCQPLGFAVAAESEAADAPLVLAPVRGAPLTLRLRFRAPPAADARVRLTVLDVKGAGVQAELPVPADGELRCPIALAPGPWLVTCGATGLVPFCLTVVVVGTEPVVLEVPAAD